ncbi:choline/Carnitine O-acyltransferase [Thraustotheca clavata]|uniref:Choline/Carnitine O-acyltransferase n=1 Tax=Thraustotheca clavata TaxID=74557 RepID=A0A1V9ZEQ8_9STRA|nr:choline/Carnitine O-acyltransferase [Thraustotheca clavata]
MVRLTKRSFSSAAGYVQQTVIPTYHFQKSLMRLPVPKLDDTLNRYLLAVEPVVSPEQFKDTQREVESFRKSLGPQLHEALVARDKASPETSYINKWWFEMYVRDRQPVAINVNPQIKIKDDPNPAKNIQNQRAASLIASSVRFFLTLRDKQLVPDIFHTKPQHSKTEMFDTVMKYLPESISFYGAAAVGAYPLDMSQYKNLFQSTRIPRVGEDVLQVFPDSKHVVVQYGSDFYTFDVLTPNGGMVPDAEILANIDAILAQPKNVSQNGLGLMTTLGRDEWAKARTHLLESRTNAASIKDIDSALFMVTLEHESPETDRDISRTFLHGNGSNHWFDKSFQLIIAANGKASVNFEHSWGDGVAVLRYLNEMYMDSVKHNPLPQGEFKKSPKSLSWDLSESTKATLTNAKSTFDAWTKRLLVEAVETPVTKAIGTKYSIGTDGVMQMAIQLAHFRLHGHFVSTYESASTAAFKHGRTETIRSCTNEAVAFCKAMQNSSASASDQAAALRTAVKKHSELTKNGVMGQGCDRHLYGLRKMAEIQGLDTPALFKLPSYDIMSHIILSTSTLSSPHLDGGSFGPVNKDCYGIGYGIEAIGSMFQLASYRTDLPDLRDLLAKSVVDIEKILQETNTK